VNFKVFNTLENKQLDFIFFENDTDHGPDSAHGPGYFSAGRSGFDLLTDYIILLERDARDSLAITWSVNLGFDSLLTMPKAGDTLTLVLSKLFRKEDVFEFTTTAQRVDRAAAKSDLEKIKVVPNPYVAAATWEEKNPYTSGRGPRAIHFNHLPQVCTIRIFTVSGELVTTLNHDAPMNDGTEEWNLLTRDNLSAAYGVYIYHVDAPGVGEKVGKFAIIK
jgi:hypothetical protein